jgi:hypothetical protein
MNISDIKIFFWGSFTPDIQSLFILIQFELDPYSLGQTKHHSNLSKRTKSLYFLDFSINSDFTLTLSMFKGSYGSNIQ